MPRKKLTKAQVKRKLKTALNMMYDLMNDKFAYPDSHVPISVTKLFELHKPLQNAWKRVK